MRLCSTEISDDEMANIILNAPEMIKFAQKEGRVSNELMDSLNIVKLPVGEHFNKDNISYYKSSCCVINLEATIRRKEADDASRKSAPEILAQKIVNAASRAVITREKSLEKKRIEKERVELLTDFERKQEKELKAQTVAIKAQAKEQKIITARAFLNAA
jgi:chromosome condensin MukBEF ATPase and DNA-binding subunit MukB